MIFLSDDYINKYQDTLSYIIGRAIHEQYSFQHIEKTIAYSKMIEELEKSNITSIAFSSMEHNYHEMFALKDNDGYVLDAYGVYGWIGFVYIHAFLTLNITFETLFYALPIQEAISIYPLYHEMDISQTIDYIKEKIKTSILDLIMKHKKISTRELSKSTNIPFSTISALRYGNRDINKLDAMKLFKIAKNLNVKMESLLPDIQLDLE